MKSPEEMMRMIERLKAEVLALRAHLEVHDCQHKITSLKLKELEAADQSSLDFEESKEPPS